MPKAGIGIPTYNGGEFIAECLACLQGQTFEDFEVAISDNGSTDGTSDICADFARSDKRFRHVRFDETVPMGQNFLRARDMTDTPYFMWRADDDLADLNYLATLVAALDATPGADLAVAPIFQILETPTIRQESLIKLPVVTGPTRPDRIAQVLLRSHPSWFYGLWRREPLTRQSNRVIAEYPYLWAWDHLLLFPTIVDERVVFAPNSRFIQRIMRVPAYTLAPLDLLRARRRFRQVAAAHIAQSLLTPKERGDMAVVLERHLARAVGNEDKAYRGLLRSAVNRLTGKR